MKLLNIKCYNQTKPPAFSLPTTNLSQPQRSFRFRALSRVPGPGRRRRDGENRPEERARARAEKRNGKRENDASGRRVLPEGNFTALTIDAVDETAAAAMMT